MRSSHLQNLVVELAPVLLKLLVFFVAECISDMAVVYPDSMAVVFAVTFHCIIGEVALGHLKIWVDDNLEDVISGFDVRYIDPLTVNVMAVQIPASHRDSLFTKVGAFIPLTDQLLALCVLQAEAGLVSFCHFSSICSQQIIVCENVHTVVMPMAFMPHPGVSASLWPEISTPNVVYLGGETQ